MLGVVCNDCSNVTTTRDMRTTTAMMRHCCTWSIEFSHGDVSILSRTTSAVSNSVRWITIENVIEIMDLLTLSSRSSIHRPCLRHVATIQQSRFSYSPGDSSMKKVRRNERPVGDLLPCLRDTAL